MAVVPVRVRPRVRVLVEEGAMVRYPAGPGVRGEVGATVPVRRDLVAVVVEITVGLEASPVRRERGRTGEDDCPSPRSRSRRAVVLVP